ncbi:MAG: type II secretion system F family protein [Methylocystaceae bacterium]
MRKLKYHYRVKDKSGRTRKGILEGENRSLVVESLVGQGYYVLQLDQVKNTGLSMDINLPSITRVSIRELSAFTRQLATMINAGLSILKCFSILSKQTQNKELKKAALQIKDDIEAGMPLYEALSKHPKIFSRMYVSMVRAGEIGGILDQVLERLSEHLEREQEVSSKVKSASVYPAIISIFAVLVVFFIITFVMPTFTSMFVQAGVSLPAPTRALLTAGIFLKSSWYLIFGAVILVVLALKQWKKTTIGSLFFDSMILRMPVVGTTVSRVTVARFARTMGTLVQSGIPVLAALEAVEEVVGNAVIARAIKKSRASIREGDTIARPLAETGVFEPMVTQMIAVGEETGTLDDMLVRLSAYFEREVMYLIDALMSVMEPILIMFVAVLVGGIVVATLLPMFDMVNLVGSGM